MHAKFYSEFDKKNEIMKISERIDEIIKYREKIVEDYLNLTTSSDPKLIKEVLKSEPSCELFNKLYEDMVNNHYQLSLQGEVISAYMKGYNASIRFQPEKVIEFYDKRKAKFDLKMSKMNFDIVKVKKLKLKKEIDY